MDIRLILTDIDGVWTDGGMYYDQTGNEWKRFCTYDGAGVTLAHSYGIPVGIITSESTEIVKRRAEKLKIDYLFQGVKDKKSIALDLCKQLNLKLAQIAYIGDDMGDLELLKVVGFSGAPKNAIDIVKQNVDYKSDVEGGNGAFRDFVNHLISLMNNNA